MSIQKKAIRRKYADYDVSSRYSCIVLNGCLKLMSFGTVVVKRQCSLATRLAARTRTLADEGSGNGDAAAMTRGS